MDARLLHQVWDVIETTQTDLLTQMDDPQLIQFLVAHLQDRNFLKPEDKANAKAYIHSRLLLIRELAQARQELCCPLKVKVALHPPLEVVARSLVAG